MAERDTSRDIDQAASDWTARLDRGPLSPDGDKALQAWLNGDPRSKGALLRARALSLMSESAQALGADFDPIAFTAPRPARSSGLSRRQALAWTSAAVGAASVAALAVGVSAAGAVISTERGELRLAPLKDGSTVLLNTDTRIRVEYSDGERRVALLKGEAYFAVARDERRPFVVEVGGCRLLAAQADFRVSKLDRAPVDILVNHGQVRVAAPELVPVTLQANTRLTLQPAASGRSVHSPQAMGPEAISRDLAWREGKLAFEGESLEQAADAFARYSDTRIQIRDPGPAREPVTGLFAANDPVGFSRAVARVFDARLERQGDRLVLTRDAASQ